MKNFIKITCGLCALTLLNLPAMAENAAIDAGLVPHKALYRIHMIGKSSSSQILNVSGKMFYEWRDDCAAWVSDHRLNVVYDYADSPSIRIKSDFSTYEPYDGRSMNFTTQKKRNGVPFKQIRGYASMDNQMVEFSKPDDLEYELPEGTLFPMGHTIEVLKQIRNGDKFYKTYIFDGNDEDGPVLVNSFLGKVIDPDEIALSGADIDQSLLDIPARKMRLSFFPTETQKIATPDYEMSIVFHDNGVISDMIVEYEDFTIEQKLVALEPQDKTCAALSKTTQ